MHFNQSKRSIALVGLASILLCCCTPALADEADARLKKRITELETENRSLRKVIGEMQKVLKSLPESTTLAATNSGKLRIIVIPGDWGGSGLTDIRKVCESAGRPLATRLPADDGFPPIIIRRGRSGPITLYERGKGNEHVMYLDTGGQAWAQLAYQFSHEFCHVVCNYREAKNPQKWFEESLCECASLYSLRRMADEWRVNPPYSNWKSYSGSLASYADDRMSKYADRTESLAEFYRANLAEFERNGTNRELNTYIAIKLLPHFEATPQAWESLRYLNLGPAEENKSFQSYLAGWHGRVPERHKEFVQRIAEEFGVDEINAD